MPLISYDMLQKGFSEGYKLLPKGPVKLIGNIVGDAITKESVNGKGYRKQEGDDKLYEIISLAQETAVQGGKAALEAARKAAEKAAAEKKKKEEEANKATTETKTEEPKTETKKTEEQNKEGDKTTPATSFGKRKRGPSASLKRMCKKHGVRLMVKRGKKRVYKSPKVLKEQCQRKLKRKLKKEFRQKKNKTFWYNATKKDKR